MPYVMSMYTYYVHRDMQTIIETVSKILSGAGLLFAFFFKKGLRPLFGTVERPRTQEKQERHRHMSRKSVWMKRLVSLSSVKSSNCAVKLQKFTDFKSWHCPINYRTPMSRVSLWILSIYAVKVRAVKTYSEHIPDILTFSIGVSVALLDMDVSPFVCVCVCVGRRLALE